MIIYQGTVKANNQVCYLNFINEKGEGVSIPVDSVLAQHFQVYFARITTAESLPINRENEESSPVDWSNYEEYE